jgi:hypothetical protein
MKNLPVRDNELPGDLPKPTLSGAQYVEGFVSRKNKMHGQIFANLRAASQRSGRGFLCIEQNFLVDTGVE